MVRFNRISLNGASDYKHTIICHLITPNLLRVPVTWSLTNSNKISTHDLEQALE